MQKTIIVTESSIDFLQEQATKENIYFLPFMITLDKKEYLDNVTITNENFYDLLNPHVNFSSSQPNLDQTINLFKELLEKYENVIYLTLPSTLSGTYSSGLLAASQVDEKRIKVIDIKNASGVTRYIAQTLTTMAQNGVEFEQLVDMAQRLSQKTTLYLIPKTFTYLKKSGRITPMAASLGGFLKITAVIHLNKELKLDSFGKGRTLYKANEIVCKHLLAEGFDVKKDKVYFCHANDLTRCQEVIQNVKEILGDIEYEIMGLAPTLGGHAGPGAVMIQTVRKHEYV